MPKDDDDEEAQERAMATRRQKELYKTQLFQADELFCNAKFTPRLTKFMPSYEGFTQAAETLRKVDARSAADVRFKKAAQNEIKRRIEMVVGILPPEKKLDVMEAMRERRRKEAEALGGADSDTDPEVLLRMARGKLKNDYARIQRQLAMATTAREEQAAAAEAAKARAASPPQRVKAEPPPTRAPEPPEALLGPEDKVSAMHAQLEGDLVRRRPPRVEPFYTFDGVSGVRVKPDEVEEDGGGDEATAAAVAAAAGGSDLDRIQTNLEKIRSGEASSGKASPGTPHAYGVSDSELWAARRGVGAAERLQALVGGEFKPSVDLEPMKVGLAVDLNALEESLLRDLKLGSSNAPAKVLARLPTANEVQAGELHPMASHVEPRMVEPWLPLEHPSLDQPSYPAPDLDSLRPADLGAGAPLRSPAESRSLRRALGLKPLLQLELARQEVNAYRAAARAGSRAGSRAGTAGSPRGDPGQAVSSTTFAAANSSSHVEQQLQRASPEEEKGEGAARLGGVGTEGHAELLNDAAKKQAPPPHARTPPTGYPPLGSPAREAKPRSDYHPLRFVAVEPPRRHGPGRSHGGL